MDERKLLVVYRRKCWGREPTPQVKILHSMCFLCTNLNQDFPCTNFSFSNRSIYAFIVVKPILSSLYLEIFVYFSWQFGVFFSLLNVGLFTFKAVEYYYPSEWLGWDLTSIFLYVGFESLRLILLSKGNKTASVMPVLVGLILSGCIAALHGYYLNLQTYVLRVDIVINAIGLALVIAEFILGTIQLITFSGNSL